MLYHFRYGANSLPKDGGMMPIIAILDKLIETPDTQLHVEICLRILLKTIPLIEMPYKVNFMKIFLSCVHLFKRSAK